LPHPIKALGLYDIRITLHPEISVIVSANIARSNEEAKIQAKTGVAVVSSTEEENKGNKEYIEDIKQTLSEQSEEIFEEGAIPEPQDLEDDEIKDEQKNKEIQEDNLD
jgi:large subunit ribosomal protein L9